MRYTSIKRAMCSLVVIAALHLQSHLALAERSSLRGRKHLQQIDTFISNKLNEPILPTKVDDTKNDHYIITSTDTDRETSQRIKDEHSFIQSHRKLQKPDYTYDCLADWTSIKSAIILSSVLSPDDPPDFVLCPDTVILLQIDETTQMEPVDIKIDNAKFKCGENGKQDDKCLIVGGYAHFRLIGNVKGVTFQGITFSGSSMASILATGESNANAEFLDCAWIDNKGLTAVLIYNEDKGVPVDKLSNIQDLVEPRAKSMTLTFRDCVFSRNKNKYSTVLNLAGKANFVSTVFVNNKSLGGSIRIKFSSNLNMVKSCFFEDKAEYAGIVVIEEGSEIDVNKDTYGEANSAEVGICSRIFYEVGDSCIDNEDEISCVGMCGFFTADTCEVDLKRVASDSNVIKSILDNTYDESGMGGGGGNFLGKMSLELLIAGGIGFVIFIFFLVCCTGRCCYRSGMKKGKADYQLLQSHDHNQGPGGPSDSCGTSGTSAPSEQPPTNIPVATPASQDIFEDNGIVASTVAQVDNDSTVAISQDKKEKKSEEGKPKPSITSPPPSAPVNRQSTNVKKASEDYLPTFKRSKRRESNASDAFAFGGLMKNGADDDDSELGVLGKKVKKKSESADDDDSELGVLGKKVKKKSESDGKEKSERKVRIKDEDPSSGEESDSDESKDEKDSKKKKSRKSLRKSRRHSTDEEATDDNEEHRKSRRHASDDEDAVKKSKSSLRKSRRHASDDEDAVKKSKDELRKSRKHASDDEDAVKKSKDELRKSRRHASDDEDAVKKSKDELRKSRRHASDDEDAVKKSKDKLRKSRRRASDDEEATDDNEEHRKSRRHASDDEDAVKKSKDELRKSRRHASDDEDAVKKSKDELRKSRKNASDDEDAVKKSKDELRKSRKNASDDEDAVKKSKDKLRKSRRRASDDEEATDDNEEHRKSRRHASDDEDAVKMGKESLRKSRRRAKDGEDDDKKKSKEKDSSKKDLVDNDHIDKRKKLEKRSSVTRLCSDDDQKQNVKTPKTGETSKRKLDRSESSSKLNRSESSRKLDRSDGTSKLKRTMSDRKLDRSESSSKLEKSDGEAKKSHKSDRLKLERQLSRSSSKMNVDSESGSEKPKLPKRTSRRYSRRLSASDLFTDDDEADAASLSSGSSAWQSSIEGSIHRSTSLTDMVGEAKAAAFRRTSLASNRSQSFSIPNRKNLLDKESVERRRASMDFSIASSMDESMGRRDSLEHKSTPKNRRDSIKSVQYDSKKKLNEEEKAQIQKRTRTRSVTPIKSRSKDGKSSPSSDEKKESSSRSKRASTERKREKSSEPRSKRSSTEKSRDRSESPVPPKKSSRSKRSDSSKEKSRKSSTGMDSKSRDRSKSPPSRSKKESKTRTRERDGSKSKKSENGGDSRKRSGLSSSMPEKKSSDSKPSANLRSSVPVSSSNRREAMKESRRASTTSIEEEGKKSSSKITKEKLLEDLNKMPKQKPDRFITNRKKVEQKAPRDMSKLAAFSLKDLKKSSKK